MDAETVRCSASFRLLLWMRRETALGTVTCTFCLGGGGSSVLGKCVFVWMLVAMVLL